MADLQELIIRGRFIFSSAPRRLDVFKLVNGKRSTKDIARKTGRSLSSVLQDIEKLRDLGLICEKIGKDGLPIKKEKACIYEKVPLTRHIPTSYFQDVAQTKKIVKSQRLRKGTKTKLATIHIPNTNEILDIAKNGEDQLYEFKSPGTESSKITKEIAAFLHTRNGGIIFYGIEDDGSIIGSDMSRQIFDQKMHNSIRNTILPQPVIEIKERNILGSKVLMVTIPPWDKRTLYQYTKNEKYYIRKGTNVFALKPDEIKRLSKGQYIT